MMRFIMLTLIHILILSLCSGLYLLLVNRGKKHRYHTLYYYIGIVLTIFWLLPVGLLADAFTYLPVKSLDFDISHLITYEQKQIDVELPNSNQIQKEPQIVDIPDISFDHNQISKPVSEPLDDLHQEQAFEPAHVNKGVIDIIITLFMVIWGVGALFALTASVIYEIKTRKRLMRHSEKQLHETLIPCYSCEIIQSPILIGLFHTVLLLPKTKETTDHLPSILAHEAVHYQRHDSYMKLLNLLATSIYWWHPLAYILAKAVETQCELSCDEQAVMGMNPIEKKQYGETILFFAGQQLINQSGGCFAMHLITDKEKLTERIDIICHKRPTSKKFTMLLVILLLMAIALWGCGMKQAAMLTNPESSSEDLSVFTETPSPTEKTEKETSKAETEELSARDEVILLAKKKLKEQYELFMAEHTDIIEPTGGLVVLRLRSDKGRYTPGDLLISGYDTNYYDTHLVHIFGETDYFTACYISEEEICLIGYKDTTRVDFDADDNIVMLRIGHDINSGGGSIRLYFVDYDLDGMDELILQEMYNSADGYYMSFSALEINREEFSLDRSEMFDQLHIDVIEEEDAFVVMENDSGFSKRIMKDELNAYEPYHILPGEYSLCSGFDYIGKLRILPPDNSVELEMGMGLGGHFPPINISYTLFYKDGKWQVRICDLSLA